MKTECWKFRKCFADKSSKGLSDTYTFRVLLHYNNKIVIAVCHSFRTGGQVLPIEPFGDK